MSIFSFFLIGKDLIFFKLKSNPAPRSFDLFSNQYFAKDDPNKQNKNFIGKLGFFSIKMFDPKPKYAG